MLQLLALLIFESMHCSDALLVDKPKTNLQQAFAKLSL